MLTECESRLLWMVSKSIMTLRIILDLLTWEYPLSEVRAAFKSLRGRHIIYRNGFTDWEGEAYYQTEWREGRPGQELGIHLDEEPARWHPVKGSRRHTRKQVRAQRQRYIARRRRQFAHWVGPIDRAAGTVIRLDKPQRRPNAAPRDRETREAEFWHGARIGSLSKWNGTCQHCARRRGWRKTKRERLEAIVLQEMRQEAV